MQVFSKSYLQHVVKTQGQLFDMYARQHPDCDTEDFISSYLNSATRASIDEGQAYVCTMDAETLMSWFLEKNGYVPKNGESMKGFMPDWIGRFYAQCQWQGQLSSRETLKKVPIAYLKSMYSGLHDLDLDLAVDKVSG